MSKKNEESWGTRLQRIAVKIHNATSESEWVEASKELAFFVGQEKITSFNDGLKVAKGRNK